MRQRELIGILAVTSWVGAVIAGCSGGEPVPLADGEIGKLAAAIDVSDEEVLDHVVWVDAYGTQRFCALAGSETGMLTVCPDSRFGGHVRAARIDADGEVIDRGGIRVSALFDPGGGPLAAASDGTDYLIAYKEPGAIVTRTVDGATGAVGERQVLLAFGGFHQIEALDAVFDGNRYVVGTFVQTFDTNYSQLYWVTTANEVQEHIDLPAEYKDMAAGNGVIGVALDNGFPAETLLGRYLPDGTLQTPPGLTTVAPERPVAAAFAGGDFAVATKSSSFLGKVYTVSDAGAVSAAVMTDLEILEDAAFAAAGDVALLAVGPFGANTDGVLVSGGTATPSFKIAQQSYSPAAIAFAGNFVLATAKNVPDVTAGPDNVGVRVTPSGAVTELDVWSQQAAEQLDPCLSGGSGNAALLYSQMRHEPGSGFQPRDLYFMPLDGAGALSEIHVGMGADLPVGCGAGDTGWLAVFSRFDDTAVGGDWDLDVLHIASDGTAGAALTIGNNYFSGAPPVVVHLDGERYVVVWASATGCAIEGCTGSEISARLVDGNQLGPTVIVAPSTTNGRSPAAARVGDDIVIAFERPGAASVDIWQARLSADLTVVQPPEPIDESPQDQRLPAIAADGERFLVVWQDEQQAAKRIVGRLTDAAGDVHGPIVIEATAAATNPAVAAAGDEHSFVVVYEAAAGGGLREIYGVWIDRDSGVIRDSPAHQLTDFVTEVEAPALTPLGAGQLQLAYHRGFDDLGARRIGMRVLDSGALDGDSCVNDEDCASRICSEEKICCRQACGICETCAEGSGLCAAVTNTVHDTCFDGEICDDEGVCKTANGEACTENDACASGVCVEGLCCDRPCDGSCALCDDPSSPGICIDRACGAYTCDTDHEALECFESCSDSSQCAADHQCIADGRCVAIDTTAAPQVVDGCSCRTGQSSAGGWLVAAIAFLGWSRRRQRRSP